MIDTKISIGKEPYKLYIGKDLIKKLNVLLAPYIENRVIFMLTDKNVFDYYGKLVIEALSENGTKFNYFVIPVGEESKSIENYSGIVSALVDKKYNRKSVLVALGGGMIGDLGGFVASTYMRGIDIIHIPTTLLSHVDSSVGGKTGINYENIKNLIGTFYHPKAVIIDTNTLNTLQNREFTAAFGEIIKYGMLRDYNLLVDLDKHYEQYMSRSVDLEKIILKCIKMKEKIVLEDENDFGVRQTLNLGHTFAHGIESSTGLNQFFHGEAVALGLLFSTKLSLNLNLVTEDYYIFIKNLIYKYFFTLFQYELSSEEILKSMLMDKKNKDDSITFILPIGQEQVRIFNDIPLATVKKTIVEAQYGFNSK